MRTLSWSRSVAASRSSPTIGRYSGVTLTSLETLGGQLGDGGPESIFVRRVHLGKTLQNTVLKFGGGPLLLCFTGLRRNEPAVLLRLVKPWFAGALVLCGLAVVTPFALRFEYFAAPAIAITAGLGAEKWISDGRGTAVRLILGAILLLQIIIGVLLLEGKLIKNHQRDHPVATLAFSAGWVVETQCSDVFAVGNVVHRRDTGDGIERLVRERKARGILHHGCATAPVMYDPLDARPQVLFHVV